ncbi:MAG: hypothetical protein EZS28_043598, partial [Streblomastix strix]
QAVCHPFETVSTGFFKYPCPLGKRAGIGHKSESDRTQIGQNLLIHHIVVMMQSRNVGGIRILNSKQDDVRLRRSRIKRHIGTLLQIYNSFGVFIKTWRVCQFRTFDTSSCVQPDVASNKDIYSMAICSIEILRTYVVSFMEKKNSINKRPSDETLKRQYGGCFKKKEIMFKTRGCYGLNINNLLKNLQIIKDLSGESNMFRANSANSKVLLVSLFMAMAITANAQLQWGVKAGLNVSSFRGIEDEHEKDNYGNSYDSEQGNKAGFHVGVAAQYLFTPQVGIETGLYYSTLGTKVTEEEKSGSSSDKQAIVNNSVAISKQNELPRSIDLSQVFINRRTASIDSKFVSIKSRRYRGIEKPLRSPDKQAGNLSLLWREA